MLTIMIEKIKISKNECFVMYSGHVWYDVILNKPNFIMKYFKSRINCRSVNLVNFKTIEFTVTEMFYEN